MHTISQHAGSGQKQDYLCQACRKQRFLSPNRYSCQRAIMLIW
ncbi:MAG TPA: hypothetical protein VFA10_04070 [Ktedonobacteraceae bacterium]|nr:hypothetical protein [Ktedonobacteraceae bacterium]